MSIVESKSIWEQLSNEEETVGKCKSISVQPLHHNNIEGQEEGTQCTTLTIILGATIM